MIAVKSLRFLTIPLRDFYKGIKSGKRISADK